MSDYQLLIDGKMVPGAQTMPVLNPATEEVLSPRRPGEGRDTHTAQQMLLESRSRWLCCNN